MDCDAQDKTNNLEADETDEEEEAEAEKKALR